MIRLFASDLDGTLLNSRHTFDEHIVDGISFLTSHGADFAVATGRGIRQCMLPSIKDQVYKICMNGALILDQEDRIIFMKEIDKEVLTQLIDQFAALPFDFVTPEKTYTLQSRDNYIANKVKTNDDEAWKERFMRDFVSHIEFDVSKEKILAQPVCKVNLRIDRNRSYDEVDAFLARYASKIMNAPSSAGLYELTDPAANKGAAVAFLCRYLGLDEDEAAVYGDGGNDLIMIERFAHSYAPENALPFIKEKACQVIGYAYDHSVIDHMKKTLIS